MFRKFLRGMILWGKNAKKDSAVAVTNIEELGVSGEVNNSGTNSRKDLKTAERRLRVSHLGEEISVNGTPYWRNPQTAVIEEKQVPKK